MKRFHVHVAVENLDASVKFYAGLFGLPPTVQKDDYAKWMLEDPRVNFAISMRGQKPGVDHLGIQVESRDELAGVYSQMAGAGQLLEQGETSCCYALSEKGWVHDPGGLAWEAFHTVGEATQYGDDTIKKQDGSAACCVPTAAKLEPVVTGASACCEPADTGASSCCPPPVSNVKGGVLNALRSPRP